MSGDDLENNTSCAFREYPSDETYDITEDYAISYTGITVLSLCILINCYRMSIFLVDKYRFAVTNMRSSKGSSVKGYGSCLLERYLRENNDGKDEITNKETTKKESTAEKQETEEHGPGGDEQGTDDEEQETEEHGPGGEEQGTDDEEQETEEHGPGGEEHGPGGEEQGTDDEEQGTDDEEQGTDDEEQGTDDEKQGMDNDKQGRDDYYNEPEAVEEVKPGQVMVNFGRRLRERLAELKQSCASILEIPSKLGLTNMLRRFPGLGSISESSNVKGIEEKSELDWGKEPGRTKFSKRIIRTRLERREARRKITVIKLRRRRNVNKTGGLKKLSKAKKLRKDNRPKRVNNQSSLNEEITRLLLRELLLFILQRRRMAGKGGNCSSEVKKPPFY